MVKKSSSDKIIREIGLVTPQGGAPRRPVINVRSLREHTFLIGLKEIIPEDILWRKEHPRVPSLICFDDERDCGCPWGCVLSFVKRCVWLFRSFPALQQVLVLFNREEKNLRRKIPTSPLTVGRDLNPDDFGESVPRVKVLYVPSDFSEQIHPYRIFRANYNGLQMVLASTEAKEIVVPIGFW